MRSREYIMTKKTKTVPLCEACGSPMVVSGFGDPESYTDDDGSPFWCVRCDAEERLTGGSILPEYTLSTDADGDWFAEPSGGLTLRDALALAALAGGAKAGKAYDVADDALRARRGAFEGDDDA